MGFIGKLSKLFKKGKGNQEAPAASEPAAETAAPAPAIAAQDSSAAASTPTPAVTADPPAQSVPETPKSDAPVIAAQDEAAAPVQAETPAQALGPIEKAVPAGTQDNISAPSTVAQSALYSLQGDANASKEIAPVTTETPTAEPEKALPVAPEVTAQAKVAAPTATGEAAEDSLKSNVTEVKEVTAPANDTPAVDTSIPDASHTETSAVEKPIPDSSQINSQNEVGAPTATGEAAVDSLKSDVTAEAKEVTASAIGTTAETTIPDASHINSQTEVGAPTATGEAAVDSLKSDVTAEKEVAAPVTARKPKIFVIIYSTWGHTKKLAEAIVKGLEEGGAEAKLWRVAETLPADVLEKMHAAPAFENIPIIEPEQMVDADGLLFGIPTRYGTQPTQIKTFWDGTGGLWQRGALVGKYGGVFHSTATQHGGQETTTLAFLPHFAHHGILYVPLGYTCPILHDNTEPVGGSPYGAGTIAGSDGSRQPSEKELDVGVFHGKHFAKIVAKSL